ncbi:MAG: heat-inducible transcription repressor HrcA [Chloroflexi bacterium]|nr:heat-inducible transcription repressor HrcA [Chloroflexota bacterium]
MTELNQVDNNALSARQREILKIVIEAYTEAAVPVGSNTIRHYGHLDVSTATIRNELVVLEELGYLTQPHTSAGRVPSVKGYRYFVECLMDQIELPLAEQRMIRHQFHQLQLNLDQWMRLTAAILAHNTQAASVITPPYGKLIRFRHLELISINDNLVLLVAVLQDGSIHQEMLIPAEPLVQELLSQYANRLNVLLAGKTAGDVRVTTPDEGTWEPFESTVVQCLADLMSTSEANRPTSFYTEGLENMLLEPEFTASEKFRQVILMLQQHSLLELILPRVVDANGIQIIIGNESDTTQLDDVSLVLSPYGVHGRALGMLGVIGPMRMAYGRAIGTVRYMAQLLNSLLNDVYGGESLAP